MALDHPGFELLDLRLSPHYPAPSPLEDILRKVDPDADGYASEKLASQLTTVLDAWSASLKRSLSDLSILKTSLDRAIETLPLAREEVVLREGQGIRCTRKQPGREKVSGPDQFVKSFADWLGSMRRMETAEFDIVAIEEVRANALRTVIRYCFVLADNRVREERVGHWRLEWVQNEQAQWLARRFEWMEESAGSIEGPGFVDVTPKALGRIDSYPRQMLRGSDYWRTVLDGACGIDVYGNNGVATGDYDGDGFDDIYICQPSGLPNRLYRNRGDGTFEDVTEKAGVGVLDNTACSLFADFDNKGRQDLLVVCGSGPLLFLNQGDGTFSLKKDAFQFRTPPQGTFTHAAVADYDGDGRLDIYFCLYSYYLGLDQYHYPTPYFDARNGPPNFLLRNTGTGAFVDVTEATGLNAENDRYSFACAWGHARGRGLPDLYVANDFGRGNLYHNNGNGTFTAVSAEAHVQDPGAGMSACWADFSNAGKQDIYAAAMWSAAGQRVSTQAQFQDKHDKSQPAVRQFYQQHARGNALYRNHGDGIFSNDGEKAGVTMGRWSWCSDTWDFDHDGTTDLYVTNGYISASTKIELASFFWRQVVANSPDDSTPSAAYEHGWNAINELIRSDRSWNGYERNVMFVNNRDGSFTEMSGALGLDILEDSRSFALADLDHDGRLEVVVKNRNAPQLRILHNGMAAPGSSIAFRLRGRKSNRDAIGAAVTVQAGELRQTKYLQAGSGFLAQHTKELFFGVGKEDAVKATIVWPSGLEQEWARMPTGHRIEVEEGVETFVAKPYPVTPAEWARPSPPPPHETLPTQIETWLIEPLRAPEFSLPDNAGKLHTLSSLRGGFALVYFCSPKEPTCLEQLRLLNRHAQRLPVMAVCVDPSEDLPRTAFPIVFATDEVAGVYNIIYRYLFDRRRDLGIPTSFLLNKEGMMVKVYQGAVDPVMVLADIASAPVTPEARIQKALPFAGVRYLNGFQRNDFTYGVALFQHGYLDQAAASFEQVIAAKPDDAEAYYNLGTLNLRRQNLEQAQQYLKKSLELRPAYPEAWNNLGMIAAQQGRGEEAVKSFQQALLLRPGYATALLNLGNLYRRQRSYAQAQELLEKALAIEPYDAEVNYSLGMLHAQQNQMDRAAEFLERAIELRPDYPEALNNLGVLLVHQQAYAQAQKQFETCIRLVPGFEQSYFNLARLYALQNQNDQAKRVLEDLLRREPQNGNARQALEGLK